MKKSSVWSRVILDSSTRLPDTRTRYAVGERRDEILHSRAAANVGNVRLRTDIGNDHRTFCRRQLRQHFADARQHVYCLVGIKVAVRREEDLGCDLPKAVENALNVAALSRGLFQ